MVGDAPEPEPVAEEPIATGEASENRAYEDGAYENGDYEDEPFDEQAEWQEPDVRRWWGWTALALSLAGFGASLYLTIDHFKGAVPICSSAGIVDCAKVTTSPQSELFGVFPVALLGLLFFTAMVGINPPWLWYLTGRWGRIVSWARLALSLSGMCFVLYLVYAELYVIKAICLWCTGVHIVTFLLFILVVATFPRMVGRSETRRFGPRIS